MEFRKVNLRNLQIEIRGCEQKYGHEQDTIRSIARLVADKGEFANRDSEPFPEIKTLPARIEPVRHTHPFRESLRAILDIR